MNLKFFPNRTNPVMLLTKGWSNPLLETSLKNLGTTLLLYYKYCKTYLYTSASCRLRKKVIKKTEIERNYTHAIKRNKRYRADTYHEMTPFIVFKYDKKRCHKRRSVTRANTDGYIFLKFLIDI